MPAQHSSSGSAGSSQDGAVSAESETIPADPPSAPDSQRSLEGESLQDDGREQMEGQVGMSAEDRRIVNEAPKMTQRTHRKTEPSEKPSRRRGQQVSAGRIFLSRHSLSASRTHEQGSVSSRHFFFGRITSPFFFSFRPTFEFGNAKLGYSTTHMQP